MGGTVSGNRSSPTSVHPWPVRRKYVLIGSFHVGYAGMSAEMSTLSETYYNYAAFLLSQQRPAEAREWAQKILAKRATMPRFARRRERPWFNRATALLKKIPQA